MELKNRCTNKTCGRTNCTFIEKPNGGKYKQCDRCREKVQERRARIKGALMIAEHEWVPPSMVDPAMPDRLKVKMERLAELEAETQMYEKWAAKEAEVDQRIRELEEKKKGWAAEWTTTTE
jgi:hypothetical protein